MKLRISLYQFEKILVLSKRAKDIYEGRNCLVDGMQGRKPTAMAQAELAEGVIVPLIKDVDPEELKAEFDDEEEEEVEDSEDESEEEESEEEE